jgi:hypothetical protein
MDEEIIGEVIARRSGSRKGSLPEQCTLKVARREDGVVLLRSVDVSGRPTMTSELTPRKAEELARLLTRASQAF